MERDKKRKRRQSLDKNAREKPITKDRVLNDKERSKEDFDFNKIFTQKTEVSRTTEEVRKRDKRKKSLIKNIRKKDAEMKSKASFFMPEIYDPLSLDTDNDGIDDRHDNDFKDSDYFESAYDVDEKDKDRQKQSTKLNFDDDVKLDVKVKSNKKPIKTKAESVKPKKKKSKLSFNNKASPTKKIDEENIKINPLTVGALSSSIAKDKISSFYRYKLDDVKEDNISLEAASSTLKFKDGASNVKSVYTNHKQKSAVKKAKKTAFKAEKASFNKGLKKELKKSKKYNKSKGLNKFYQKQKIKRSYKKKRYGSLGKRLFTKGKGKLQLLLRAKGKKILLIILAILLLIVLIVSILSAVGSMAAATGSAIASSSYKASDVEVTKAELEFTRLEALLTKDIEETEENYPDYDEYRFNLDNIKHDPHKLISYLTAKYGEFDESMVNGEIKRVFEEKYTLSREVVNEPYTTTTSYTDANGNTHTSTTTHDWYVLITTLKAKDLEDEYLVNLTEKEKEVYYITLDTKGNFTNFPSPIRADWSPLLTSPFGYRIHPIRKELHIHTGMDIGSPQGTDLRSIFEGTVVKTGFDDDGYGNYIIVEDKNGYRILYGHCNSLVKNEGDKVIQEEVIAKMGSTGMSTGSHLHIEITDDKGNLLNPYFYLSSKFTDVADVTENKPDVKDTVISEKEKDKEIIIAPTGTLAKDLSNEESALFKEINKHLGKPYEFGATGPDKFDCASFVCYSYTHSGYFDTGSVSAQGLYDLSRPVEKEDLRIGDLIFFTKTYDSGTTVSHVGIYAGENFMVHAGDPVKFSKFDTDYFKEHFYGFGRIKED